LPLRNPKIAIIGAGKLAYSLTDALIKNKYKITIIVSKNRVSALELAKKYRIENYSSTIKDIPLSTSIFFLTVPDDQISSLANQLAKLKFEFKKSIFVHFSGAKNVFALKNLQNKKANTASFHIMQTFPLKRVVKINNCFAAIETKSKSAQKFLKELADRLELHVLGLSSNQKVNYHLAGVFASNFLVSNLSAAEALLQKIKKGKSSFEIISPIIYSTLRNMNSKGTKEAVSGPINRGDFETIKTHSSFLKKFGLSNKKQSISYFYLSYLVQSLGLLEIVHSKRGKLDLNQVKIEKFLLREIKRFVNLIKT
jgi:predicted short-subunit dehydrogenase-like oxidoreductase (DUF2520 family)